MMNENVAKGKWTQIKGEIQKTWGKITGDELEQTKGDMKSIAGLMQERYGLAKEDADRRLSELSERFADKVSSTAENLKDKLERSNDDARKKM